MRSSKRTFDLVVASLALVALSPVWVACAVAVYLDMGLPVLFRQQRPGLHQRPFRLLKFRTMRNETEVGGRPLSDGERLTEIGRFLRRSKP